MCFLADLTLMLAWNSDEAGKIIETYKSFENRPPDLIMERSEQYPHQKVSFTLLCTYLLYFIIIMDYLSTASIRKQNNKPFLFKINSLLAPLPILSL